MPGSDGRKLKWWSGISITTVIAIVVFYFMLTDRAVSTGEEKAAHAHELSAVEMRVDILEKSSDKMDKVMYGESLDDGMIQAVVELSGKMDHVNTQVGDLKKQSNLILEELRKK